MAHAQCTSGTFRYLAILTEEPARQRARELVNTPEFVKAQRERKKVEALFAELKNQIGLRRLRLRGLKFVSRAFLIDVTFSTPTGFFAINPTHSGHPNRIRWSLGTVTFSRALRKDLPEKPSACA